MPDCGTNARNRPGAAKMQLSRLMLQMRFASGRQICASHQGVLMPETKFWAEMAWADFQARDMARTIVVLPLAATEQHGPHLPLGTDTFIMEGYIAKVIERAFHRAYRFSWYAQPVGRIPHQRLDKTLRMRASDRLPQARTFELPWRQFSDP
jgi:Creatinine amidohydrolase